MTEAVAREYTPEEMALLTRQVELRIMKKQWMDEHKRDFWPWDNWYDWQKEAFNSRSTQVMTLAANRCCSLRSFIDAKSSPVRLSSIAPGSSVDVQSWDGEQKCIRKASGLFLKGIERAYRLGFSDGRWVEVSATHRLLTLDGWVSLADYVRSSYGRCYWRKVLGWQDSYPIECDSHDAQLLLVANSDPQEVPLSTYAHKRAHYVSPLDEGEYIFRCSHSGQQSFRIAIEDALCQPLALTLPYQYSNVNRLVPPPTVIPEAEVQRYPELVRLSQLKSSIDVDQFLDTLRLEESSEAYFDSNSPEVLRASPQGCRRFSSSISLGELDLESLHGDKLEGIYSPYEAPELVGGAIISYIEPVGLQPIVDITVSDTQCYFAAGAIHHNSGKTMSAGYHTACDLTGDYPAQWTGYKFAHAPNVLVSGVDNQQVKDVVQKELFGTVTENRKGKKSFTGGWVHRDEIGRITWSKVTTDLAVSVEVMSKFGRSNCRLRAYTQSKTGQGSLSFAGTSLDKIWVDECPPDALVGQLVTRTMTGNMGKGGHITYTMTPELGATKLVTNFMEYRESSQQLIGPVSWAECPHLSDELQATILQGIPEHEQEMRSKGVPYFGSGLVYAIPESRISCTAETEDGKPITSLPWLRFIRAMDIGINHPTAIAWLAYDAEIDRIYVLRTYSEADSAAAVHAAAANSYLDFAPCVFPHDIDNREKGSGKTVRQYYAEAGLRNTLDFKNADGSLGVEAGIAEIYDRMRSDRFMVVNDCTGFFRELRLYHRDNGKIVKLNDDIMDAVRYGAMMITRHGVPMGGRRGRKRVRVLKSF